MTIKITTPTERTYVVDESDAAEPQRVFAFYLCDDVVCNFGLFAVTGDGQHHEIDGVNRKLVAEDEL